MSQYDFRMQGSGTKGVLLVHGLTGSPAEMRFVGKQLNRQGFTVYAPTLAGHCADEKTLLGSRYEDWVASIRHAIRKFAAEVDEVYLAGICVGGAIALLAAITQAVSLQDVFQRFIDSSAFIQPVLLSILLLLYMINEVLARLNYWQGFQPLFPPAKLLSQSCTAWD